MWDSGCPHAPSTTTCATSSRAPRLSKGVRVQAVLPGATATGFWATGGLPVEHLDQNIVMSADAMVDAALVGFDRGELMTIASLRDVAL